MANRIFLTSLILLLFQTSLAWSLPGETNGSRRPGNQAPAERMAIVTYASDNIQERSARALIRSVRMFGGEYGGVEIYVALGDPENFPCRSLEGRGVTLVPLEIDEVSAAWPLAIKAFAAAEAEKLAAGRFRTLAWFDPATIVTGPLGELDLEGSNGAAMRPVSLLNAIGLAPGAPPDDYWKPIYEEFGLDPAVLPSFETVVDEKPIQPYFNCEIFSVDPGIGIFAEWQRVLTKLLADEQYREGTCNTFQRRLFLHQAVLSGVVASRVGAERLQPLSIRTGYPFGQHERLQAAKAAGSLDDLSAIIFDYIWDRNPGWSEKIPAGEGLVKGLAEIYTDYLRLSDNLYRIEGSCNSYLVTTKKGSVLIDPAGAAAAPQYFKSIIAKHPLKAILLTHAHRDHWDNMDVWTSGGGVPIIAQRGFAEYNEYQRRLLPFFERRAAVWARKPLPDASEIPPFDPVVPTTVFADEYTYESGGFTFKMFHTPGETPDHATIWVPELGAVFVGDNYYEYFINNATLRGTQTRPILGYIAALDLALSRDPEFFLPGHGSPVVSGKIVKKTIGDFRDMLSYIHDETVKGMNEGRDVHALMRDVRVPDRYEIRPYFGKVEWTVRGIFHEYAGWFDENPASMYGEPAAGIYPDLAELAGTEAILDRAKAYVDSGEAVKALHLTDVVLGADPSNAGANEIRLGALRALRAGTNNYIERIWLDYGIRSCEDRLRPKQGE